MDLNTIRKITIQAETQGVDQATQGLNKLASAQGNVSTSSTTMATVTDVSTRKQLSAADAYQRQTLAIDPLARAQSLLAKQVNIANAAFSQGALGDVNSAQAKAVLSQRVADLTSKYMAHVGAADQVKTGWLSMINVEGLLERSMIRLGELFALREILIFTKDIFENTAALKDQAERVGEGVEAFQAQTAVLRQAGLTTQDAGQSIAKLNKNIGEAMFTTGAARTAFHDLGITFTDLAGGPEAALPKVAEHLLKISDASERARLEVVLFGKSGQQLESSLRALADPTASLIEQQKALGQVIGTDVVDAAHEADVKINQSWKSIMVGVAPIVVGLTNGLIGLFGAMKDIATLPPPDAKWLQQFGGLKDNSAFSKNVVDAPPAAGLNNFGSTSTALPSPPSAQFGQQEWAQYLKDQEEAARLTGLSAQERAAETEAIKESVKYQELSGVSAKDLNHTYEGAKTTLDAHTLAHARNLGLMSEQNKAAEKLKETYDQYLAGLGQEAHDAGLTNSQRAIELDTIKAAQIVQKENNVLSRDQVKTYQDALNVLGPIKAAEVERAEQAKATAAFTLQSTQQEKLAQTAFAAGRDDRQLAVEMKQKELELGRQLTDVEKDRLKTTQQLQDATRLKDYMADMQQDTKLAGLSADERARELAVIQQMHATHGALTSDQADALRNQIALTQEMQRERQLVDGIGTSFQDFFTNVLDTGKASFSSLWDAIKHQFDSMLAYMAAQALISPIIIPMVEAFGGSSASGISGMLGGATGGLGGGVGGSLGLAANAASLGGSMGMFSGLGSSIGGGIASLGSILGFGSAATAGGLTSLGTLATGSAFSGAGIGAVDLGSISSGLPGISGSLFGSTTLGGFLGGAGLGALAGSLVFGNKNDAGIGSMGGAAAGALAGSLILPGVGTIIGGLLGGLTGGGLGSITGSSNQGAIANFNADGSNYLFKQGGGNNGQMATQAAQTITTAIQTLQGAGVNVSLGNISGLSIGSDKSYVYGYDGMKDKLAGGDVTAVVNEIFNKILPSASTTDPTVQGILDKYNANGGINAGNLTQLAQDIQTAQQAKTAADTASIALQKQITDFGPAIAAALKKITDPTGSTFDTIVAAQQVRLAQAQQLGVDANQLNALNDAEINQFLKGLSSIQLHGLIAANDITGGIADQAQSLADTLDLQAKATADAAAQAQAAADAATALSASFKSLSGDIKNSVSDAQAAANTAQQTANAWSGANAALTKASLALLISAPGTSPLDQYNNSRQQFDALRTSAYGGNATSANDISGFASQFLQSSFSYNGSTSAYGSDLSYVKDTLSGLTGFTKSQQDLAQAQADSLSQAVTLLQQIAQGISDGTSSTSDDLQALRAQVAVLTAEIKQGNLQARMAA